MFTVLSVCSYAIPVARITSNVNESIQQLKMEGLYYHLLPEDDSWTVDNYTIAIMMNEASHRGVNPVSSAAYNYYWRGENGDQQIDALEEGLGHTIGDEKDNSWVIYGRYWHGYLALLMPLLMFLNLYQIRSFFTLALGVIVAYVTILVSRRASALSGVLFFICLCLAHLPIIGISLPFFFSFFVGLLATIFVLRHRDGSWALDGGIQALSRWLSFYFAVGALTVYFDFLDTPIITLGLPLVTQTMAQKDAIRRIGFWRALVFALLLSLSWGVGYLGLMVSKWVLSSLVTGYDFVGDGVRSVRYRSSEVAASGTITRSMAVVQNIDVLVERWLLVGAVAMLAVALVWACWRLSRCNAMENNITLGWRQMLLVLMVCTYPYLWYVVAANHSYIHAFITYRDQVVTLVGLALILGEVLSTVREAKRWGSLERK